MVRSGVPLYQSMSDIAPYARHGVLRKVIPDLQSAVQSGQKLSGAMAMHPKVFPVHAISSVWAGELSGRLDVALEEVAADFEQEAREVMWARIGWGLTKANVISFILIYPALNFEPIFQPFITGNPSGNPLQSAIAAYLQALPACIALSVALIAFWILWGHAKRVPTVKSILDTLLLEVPLWGKLHRFRAIARFTHVLDSLYSASVPPSSSWDCASLTVRNSKMAERLKLARGSVSPDAAISELFASAGVFDHTDVGMAVSGEKAGRLPEALSNISRIHAREGGSRAAARSHLIHQPYE